MRQSRPLRDGDSAYFGQLNCGKRSIAFDLKRPSAVARMRRLTAVSDVVVENFRPGVMQRPGLDYRPHEPAGLPAGCHGGYYHGRLYQETGLPGTGTVWPHQL